MNHQEGQAFQITFLACLTFLCYFLLILASFWYLRLVLTDSVCSWRSKGKNWLILFFKKVLINTICLLMKTVWKENLSEMVKEMLFNENSSYRETTDLYPYNFWDILVTDYE